MSWVRLNEDELSEGNLAQAVEEQGPNAIAAWIHTLTMAKRQNKKGLVRLSAVVMARECGLSTELASTAITGLVTNGVVLVTSEPMVYQVPDWPERQPDGRPASKDRLPGTPREPVGVPGLRDVTGRDVGKTHSASTSAASAPRRGGARARSRAAHETRQALIAAETARLQGLSGEPE